MKSTNTQVHRQVGKKTDSSQALKKAKSIVRARATVEEMLAARSPGHNGELATQFDSRGQLVSLSAALELSADERLALDLVAQWEHDSPLEACRAGLCCYLESSFSDLQSLAMGQHGKRPEEQAWARKFYSAVKNCFTEDGDMKEFEPTPAGADGESPDDAKGALDPIKSKTPVTLVFTGPDGREVARVAMSGQLFTGLKVAARKLGVSISKFVERLVREDLKRRAALVKGGTL